MVGVGHDRLVGERRRGEPLPDEFRVSLQALPVAFVVEGVLGVLVEERVEALVHPGPAPFVGAHHHRKPGVPELVVGDAEEVAPPRLDVAEHDLRVLHPRHDAGHVDGVRVGVGGEEVRVEFDGVLRVRGRLFPARVGLGAEPLLRVEGLSQDRAVAGVGPRGVPDEGLRGRPREVADAFGRVAPGERPAAVGPRAGASHLSLPDDRGRLPALAGLLEPLALGVGQHLARVLEAAGGGHDHLAGHGDVDVEGAVLQVVLALAQVGQRVPAVDVVVDVHSGVPLRELVDGALLDVEDAVAVGPELRNREGPVDGKLEGPAARGERLLERHEQAGAPDRVVRPHRLAVPRHLDGRQGVPRALEEAAEAGVGRHHAGPAAVGPEVVLLELHPEPVERAGRVVGVGDRLPTGEPAGGGVELDVDLVVGLVLPVLVARPPVGGAVLTGIRQIQGLEGLEVVLRDVLAEGGQGSEEAHDGPERHTEATGHKNGGSVKRKLAKASST